MGTPDENSIPGINHILPALTNGCEQRPRAVKDSKKARAAASVIMITVMPFMTSH
jgi:hypothetical protein